MVEKKLKTIFKPVMRVQESHAHAYSPYRELKIEDCFTLIQDMIQAHFFHYKSLTVHLPLELQHPTIYPNQEKGFFFIRFGKLTRNLLGIKLHWENAPLLNYGTWDLKSGQTVWDFVPKDISLCLDTGHLILGSTSQKEARSRIEEILSLRGKQINHLHLHVNDFLYDEHNVNLEKILEVFGGRLLCELISKRTFILENGS